jgi:hypothetical protein
MATRTVTGDVVTAAGAAWPDGDLGIVTFTIKEGTWTSTEHAPPDRVTAALSTGAFSATLFAPATYEVRMPNGYIFDLVVPEGASETIETLRAAAESEPEITSILTTTVAHKTATVVNANGTADYETLALALAGGAKWIVLKPGTYSGTVTITQDDVKIFGYGSTWTENVAGTTFSVSGARVSIEGIHFSGSHDGDEGDMTAHNAIYVSGNWAKIHRCKFTNLQGYAVNVDDADDVEISNCYAANVATAASPVKYTRYCFYVANACLRPNVHDNYITGWSQAIGFWYGTSYGVGESNFLVNNCGHEASVTRRSAIEDFGDTVQNYGNRWLNNYIDGSTSNCIELAQGLNGTLVQGNVLKNAGLGYLTGGGPIMVTGGDGGAGGETSDGVQIIANRIYGRNDNTVSDGCGSSGGIDGLLYQDNEFYDFLNATATVYIQSSGSTTQKAVIKGNKFRNCGGGGQAVIRVAVAGCDIIGNDVESAIASTAGIRTESTTGHTIAENRVSVTAQAIYDAENSQIINNRLTSSASLVVNVEDDNTIADNVIYSSSVAVDNSQTFAVGDRNLVRGNRSTRAGGSGYPMYTDGTDNRIVDNWFENGADTHVVVFDNNSRRNVLVNNTHVRPDNSLGIQDSDGTASNSKNYNHTLTTLGTW